MSGKRVCAWCEPQHIIGDVPELPDGEVTHGLCHTALLIQTCLIQPITYYACGNHCTVTGQPASEKCKHGKEQVNA